MIHWLISYLTLKEVEDTYRYGWRCYRDRYGDVWLKTSRWSFFATPVVAEQSRKQMDDWYHL